MKIVFLIFLAIFNFAHAREKRLEGVIVVLEAPVLAEESMLSKVLDRKRKGEKIIIYRAEVSADVYRYRYGDTTFDNIKPELSGNENLLEGYYKVATKTGGEGYVPKKYVKLIYKDSREFASKMNRFPHDPTDYRLEEPLPKGYPIKNESEPRGIFTFGFGSSFKTNYDYPTPVDKEDFRSRMGLNLMYLKNVKIDPYNRFYFGGMIHAYTEEARFDLQGLARTAKERRGQIGIGPVVSYDIWRRGDYRISTLGMIPVNINRVIITQRDYDDSFEERIFNGLSITPKVASFFQIRNLHPNLDFILGAEMQFQLSHSLSSGTEVVNPTFWNEGSDKVTYPFGATFAFLLGIQSNY